MAHGVEIAIVAKNYADAILKPLSQTVRTSANVINKSVMSTAASAKVVTKSMMSMAKGSVKAANSIRLFRNSTKKSVQSAKDLASSVKKLALAYLGFRALQGLLSGMVKFADAFNTQTTAVNGLAKALQLSGEFSEQSMQSHKAFAAQMQAGANVGDEVTLGLMKQASMLGVSDEELQNVTKTAIGLSEATGIELNTALKRTVGAMSGVMGELGEVIPTVRQAQTEEEKLAAVTAIAAKGFEQKKSSIESLRGIMTKARNTIGDMMEKIGELLSPILKVVYEGFHVLALAVQSSIDDLIEMGGGLESIETVARAFVQTIVRRFLAMHAAVQIVFKNFGKVVELAMAFGKLKILNFVGDVTHFFTVNLPGIFAWFGRNVFALFRDSFKLIITVATNFAKMLGRIIMAAWEFISSGFEGGFSALGESLGEAIGNGLTEGFVASTEALPELTGRQLTETEKNLQKTVTNISSDLRTKFDDLLRERLGLMDAMAVDAGELDPLKAMKKTGKEDKAQAQAFESRLLTRAPVEVTMLDVLKKIDNNTSNTASNTKEIVENTYDDIKEQEVKLSFTNLGQ